MTEGRENPYDGIASAIAQGAGVQAAAINRASDIAKETAEKNIAFLTEQSAIARDDLAPFREAGVNGVNGVYDLLGMNGSEAQQAYITGLVNSGSQMAQPTIDLLNSWNQANNPLNQLPGLVDYTGQVVGNPVAPTSPDIPEAMKYDQIVNEVYNNQNIKNALDQEIQYGMRGMNNSIAAQGMQGSGRQLEQLQNYGQDRAAGRYADFTKQAADYSTSAYGGQIQGILGKYNTQAGIYGQELNSSTAQKNNMLAQGMGAANSAYGVNTSSLANLFGNSYQSSVGSVQQSLLALVGSGQNAANSTANNANALGQNVSATNQWGGEAQANAALQYGQVMAQSYQALAQNSFAAGQAGYKGTNGSLNFM